MRNYRTYQVEVLRKERLLSASARKALKRFIGADQDPVDLLLGGSDDTTRDMVELLTSADEEARWLARCHNWERQRLEEIERYPFWPALVSP